MFSRLPTLHKIVNPFLFSTKKVQIFINGKPYQVHHQLSIFQAAKQNGIQIPRFCYHERLKVAGNCRMCLVQVQKAPKPIASCCSQVAPAMRINTNSQNARIARGGVMQFILANHPLDCPVCDQGGECDLQNNSISYGFSSSRHNQEKRAVEDKNIGPLVLTHMNRCIHCTRCIRFAQQVAGFHDLGTSGRGRATQIGTYVQKLISSEMSGNLADICPVGALNHGPTAYTIRPYELLSENSIDVLDSLGSNIQINHKENTVMRILPRVNEKINEEWLSDKSRQSFDGLKRQRIQTPLLRKGQNFVQYDWEQILQIVANRIHDVDGQHIFCGIGEFESVESIFALKNFMNSLNSFNYEFRKHNNFRIRNNFRTDYLFNTQIQSIEDADLIFLVGVNPKSQVPVLNSRILKTSKNKNVEVFVVGTPADLSYPFQHLGANADILNSLRDGKHPLCEKIKSKKHPLMIVGKDALTRSDGEAILKTTKMIANQLGFVNRESGWNGYNILNRSQAQINALEVGMNFNPNQIQQPKVIILLGCDNHITSQDIPEDSFVIYVGSHGDQGAQYSDVILPVATYSEKFGTYVNAEGRVQLAVKAVDPPGHSRQAWEVFRALSELCGVALPYNSIEELRAKIYEMSPHLLKYNKIQFSVFGKISNYSYGREEIIAKTPFVDTIDNFYMTDAITRNSITMAKCSTAFNPLKFSNFKKLKL